MWRVATQGRQNADQWVTSYYVSYSVKGFRFVTYKEYRRTKVSDFFFDNRNCINLKTERIKRLPPN